MLKIFRLRNDMKVGRCTCHTEKSPFSPIVIIANWFETNEDESYVDIPSISLCGLCIQLILVGWHDYFS